MLGLLCELVLLTMWVVSLGFGGWLIWLFRCYLGGVCSSMCFGGMLQRELVFMFDVYFVWLLGLVFVLFDCS